MAPFVPTSAPVTTIKAVTESVPYLTRDLGYWPCLSGETFPPSRTSAASYGLAAGLPAVQIPGTSLATPSSATWPQLPLPNDKTLLQLTHYVNITNSGGVLGLAEAVSVAAANAPTQQLGLQWSQAGGTTTWTGIPGGGSLPAAYDFATWFAGYRKITYQLGLGVAQILIDDVLLVDLTPAQAAAVVPGIPFSAGLAASNPTVGGGAAPILNIAAVETRWL